MVLFEIHHKMFWDAQKRLLAAFCLSWRCGKVNVLYSSLVRSLSSFLHPKHGALIFIFRFRAPRLVLAENSSSLSPAQDLLLMLLRLDVRLTPLQLTTVYRVPCPPSQKTTPLEIRENLSSPRAPQEAGGYEFWTLVAEEKLLHIRPSEQIFTLFWGWPTTATLLQLVWSSWFLL